MRRAKLIAALMLAACLCTGAARAADDPGAKASLDWDAITKEATELLSACVKINTVNPPGNEVEVARLLRERLLSEGIPAVIFESAPGRGIIAARLKGSGRLRKALILLSHLDTVPADPKEWQVPPFSGQIKDGAIWGRGALDDKGPGVVELMGMVAVKRSRILLDRDVIFLATADEEAGGKAGAGWIIQHQPNLFADAGYVLNEGGEIRVDAEAHRFYSVAVTEKSPLWLRLVASGPSGHASAPSDQTAVNRLVRALGKLADYQPAIKLEPVVEQYFRGRGRLEGKPEYEDLKRALKDPEFAKKFLAVPVQNALVRDTATPTMLAAGQKINVIPSEASAELDCRLLPGDEPKAFIRNLHEVIGDDNVKIEQLFTFDSLASPERGELMTAINALARRIDDDAPVLPSMGIGFTDCHYFRALGLVAYGFVPIELDETLMHTIHGSNERMPIAALRGGIQRMAELLQIMGTAGKR